MKLNIHLYCIKYMKHITYFNIKNHYDIKIAVTLAVISK